MKIAIFGASGRTGTHIVEQALAAGHQVIALVRTPAKLEIQNPNLQIVQGDVSDAQAVEKTISGADAVISVLAPTRDAAQRPVTQGTKHILAAMQKHGVKRLVVSTGAGVSDPKDGSDFMSTVMGVLVKTMARDVYDDMLSMTNTVRASDRDWTIVRAPMLTDHPRTGNIKVAWVGKGMKRQITRADMADFMLQQVNDDIYLKQAPAISNS